MKRSTKHGNGAMKTRNFSLALGLAVVLSVSTRAEDMIQVGYGEGEPGDTGIEVIVTATNDVDIHGYSLSLAYPTEVLRLVDFSTAGTHVFASQPTSK